MNFVMLSVLFFTFTIPLAMTDITQRAGDIGIDKFKLDST